MKPFWMASLLILLLSPAWGAVNRWSCDGPYGGFVSSFALSDSDPGLMLAGMSLGGTFRSANGGQDWSRVSPGGASSGFDLESVAYSLLFDRHVRGRALMGGVGEVRLSCDGGLSWETHSQGLPSFYPVRQLVQAAGRTGTILAGVTGHGVYRSVDGGRTWSPPAGAIREADVTALCADSSWSAVYAASDRGFFRSMDEGLTWEPLSFPGLPYCPGIHVDADHRVLAATSAGLFRSSDRGGTWERLSALPCQNLSCVVTDPARPRTVFAGSMTGGLYRSADGGASWVPLRHPMLDSRVTLLAWSTDGKTLFAAGGAGLSSTRNGGLDWTPVFDNGPGISVNALLHVPYLGGLYAGTEGGVSVRRSPASPWELLMTGVYVNSLAMTGWSPPVLYAGTETAGVLRSEDGGLSWSPANGNLPSTQRIHVLVLPGQPDTLHAYSCGSGVFRSEDGGETWESRNDGLTDLRVCVLAGDSARPSLLYAGCRQGLYRSEDGGRHWSALPGAPDPPALSLLVDSAHTGVLYMGTLHDLWRSADGGTTWTPAVPGRKIPLVTALFRRPATGELVAAGSGVFRSQDDGLSWTACGFGYAGALPVCMQEDPFHPDTLLLGGEGGVWSLTAGRDLDGDGAVGLSDVLGLSAFLDESVAGLPTGPWAGDVNLDGRIDLLDRLALELSARE